MHGKGDVVTQAQRVGDVPCLCAQLIIFDDNNSHLVIMTIFFALHQGREWGAMAAAMVACVFLCTLLCLESCRVSEVRDRNSYLFNATN
jgi:hypothetical protein